MLNVLACPLNPPQRSHLFVYLFSHHARLAQPILHHQHLGQAQRGSGLELSVGDFQGRGGHLGQRLENEDKTRGVNTEHR